MKRIETGYTPRFRVLWFDRGRATRPCTMGWAQRVRERMRARGHRVGIDILGKDEAREIIENGKRLHA